MLLTFPQLLTFEFFAPLVLRLALATFFITAGIGLIDKKNRENASQQLKSLFPTTAHIAVWGTALVELALGLLFILGFLTQIAGIIGMFYAVKFIIMRKLNPKMQILARYDTIIYIFIFASSLALLLLGVGALGIDLPL